MYVRNAKWAFARIGQREDICDAVFHTRFDSGGNSSTMLDRGLLESRVLAADRHIYRVC